MRKNYVKGNTIKKILSIIVIFTSVFVFTLAQSTTVTSFSGNGIQNTMPFQVADGWEIQWNAYGDYFGIYLYKSNGELVNIAANQAGSGKGSSFQPSGGKYYLQVNAMGNWSIKILQNNRNESKSNGSYSFSGSGGLNTKPFKTTGPWKIKWNASGEYFGIYLYSKTGDLINIAANQVGPGSGSSFQPKRGEYYMQINAIGSWTIQVLPYK